MVVGLNPEASLVWRLCDGKRNLGEIEVLLSEAYPDASDRRSIVGWSSSRIGRRCRISKLGTSGSRSAPPFVSTA